MNYSTFENFQERSQKHLSEKTIRFNKLLEKLRPLDNNFHVQNETSHKYIV